MYCLINLNKLKQFKFENSYKDKISILEKELRGINTTYSIHIKDGLQLNSAGSISEGIYFFRKNNIKDENIYALLLFFKENKFRIL